MKHNSLILSFVVGQISHRNILHIMNLTFAFYVIDAANLSQVLLTSHLEEKEGRGESASTLI